MWELINLDGAITATGVTTSQDSAMQSAWRAARSISYFALDEFRQIILGRPEGRTRKQSAKVNTELGLTALWRSPWSSAGEPGITSS
jgi:hypothetical protein